MHIVIIGNGIAGITAARYLRMQSDDDITIISAETTHFFSRCALMYLYMGHMRYEDVKPYEDHFWEKNNLNLVQDFVIKIETEKKQVILQNNPEIRYDKLLIATGSKSNILKVPGIELKGVQGLYSIQDLQSMVEHTKNIKKAVVVGGGLIGIEMCEMLRSQKIEVTFLVRENNYFDLSLPETESQMLHHHIREHHVDLRLETELREMRGNNGRVSSVITSSGEEIPCDFVGITVGVSPNIELIKDSEIQCKKGVLINEFMQTNVADVYAAGDCAEFIAPPAGRNAIESFWYTGKMQGKGAAFNILNLQKPYDPGVYFNSAKFFDIEYQVYGLVPNQSNDELDSIFWQDKRLKRSVRIVFDKKSKELKGFNLLGVRYRHQVCHDWISERKHMDFVMENLPAANFDPEFSHRPEPDIVKIYNDKFNSQIKLKSRRRVWDIIFKRALNE